MYKGRAPHRGEHAGPSRSYVDWIRRFILFNWRHPKEMGAPEVEAFLTPLVVQGKVAASTQNQALNPIVFLYRKVLKKDFGWLESVERAKKLVRLPVVFMREEARAVLSRLDGIRWVMASTYAGSGLRLMECTRLRVKDVDFDQHQLIVRDGKGGKDRITMLRADPSFRHGDTSFPRDNPSFPRDDPSFPPMPTTYPSVRTMIRAVPTSLAGPGASSTGRRSKSAPVRTRFKRQRASACGGLPGVRRGEERQGPSAAIRASDRETGGHRAERR